MLKDYAEGLRDINDQILLDSQRKVKSWKVESLQLPTSIVYKEDTHLEERVLIFGKTT
jgi:hypothetical protein